MQPGLMPGVSGSPEHTEAPLWLWDVATASLGEVPPEGRALPIGEQEQG